MVIDFLPSVVLFLHVIAVALALSLVSQTDNRFLCGHGAVSTSHWLLALFVGIAKPLQVYPPPPLLLIYIVNLMTILLISLCISPFIKFLINYERAHITLIGMGLIPGPQQSDRNHPDQNILLKSRLC